MQTIGPLKAAGLYVKSVLLMAKQTELEHKMEETMQETMKREKAEAIATLNRANRALERIFGVQEEEEDNE